ncbi:hypothetical protein FB451DRAFT_1558141 [Mycena latifolia]|nr:hypothetical protein FB451DRAFT_1558141 [Mycena latifolia]
MTLDGFYLFYFPSVRPRSMPATRSLAAESSETMDYDAPISPDSSVDDFTSSFLPSTFVLPAAFEAPEIPGPKRARHSRKQPAGHIPRPPNAFILFRSSFIRSQRVSSEVETNHSTLSKIIGLTWQNLPEGERRVWHAKAREAGEEHRRKFPAYAFRPVHRRAPGGAAKDTDKDARRRVREHGVDDPARCKKIAALLVEGKHGRALDEAVHEFDAHRGASPIVARFEAPITATAYRRASSAPAPDTEPPTVFLHSASTNLLQRRRSSSSGPSCRSPAEDSPPAPADLNGALDTFVSPWTPEPEAPYFDFEGFSFSPTGPPSPVPSLSCDPLWRVPDTPAQAPDFKFAGEPSLGAFIADDWARAMQALSLPATGYAYDDAALAPLEAFGAYPAQIDADLAQLMAEYSFDASSCA